ncbi:beta-lactamase-like protein [Lophiotrema nucula]|uniref:Protein artemis n=1 Tax=Lophiotrema nucula TaxID=690887 RepID=A0A6A5YYC2_9PLEO|nr:beta-lactamase-like protein [Lophiotrema nucula]
MSTFKGIVAEFPDIRIDYFRRHPEHKPPLACFLSHVHSDHLIGLEGLRAPFVYCSAATREILLRLEKKHYRLNFARGILESRKVTYDKSMRRLAKPLPLETPTEIELAPRNTIRVTLFDANHCVGAVMFLLEGDGKAILYTGDIRAETWWVNSLVQNPLLLPYTLHSRSLDCIYLDTTFATKSQPYRDFPSKAEGIRELLAKVSNYPDGTIFYFHSWTFGYENVWIALSAYLRSRIHVDEYRHGLYSSLSSLTNKYLKESGHEIREAPSLFGYRNGNRFQPGCLTAKQDVRLHSCERGTGCPVMDGDSATNVIHIIPIITRVNGTEIAELGAGGGKGDLDVGDDLETDNAADIGKLMELCAATIEDPELCSKVLAWLEQTLNEGHGKIELDGVMLYDLSSSDELSLQALVSVLITQMNKTTEPGEKRNETIRFPYSRHSSYAELCSLVEAFKPKDVFPCTVDEERWTPEFSVCSLFGAYCSADIFRHDTEMMVLHKSKTDREKQGKRDLEQSSTQSQERPEPRTLKRVRIEEVVEVNKVGEEAEATELSTPQALLPASRPGFFMLEPLQDSQDEAASDLKPALPSTIAKQPHTKPIPKPLTPSSSPNSSRPVSNKGIAYQAAQGLGLTWWDFGGLTCTKPASAQDEEEL